jgi:hypothetical protein
MPSEALKATKQIVGSYAHLKPDQPEIFLASIAAVLAQYPWGIVEECADPRKGIARTVEFLSVAKVADWCDERLAFYQSAARYVPPAITYVERELTDKEQEKGLAAFAGLMSRQGDIEAMRALTFDSAAELGRKVITERK